VRASKGGEEIDFHVYERQRKARRPLTEDEKRYSWNKGKTDMPDLVSAGDLVLKIKTYTRGAMAEDYRDQKAPLEDQLGRILVAFEAGIAELQVWSQERAEQAERNRRDEIARYRRRERRAAEEAQRERLLQTAADWRRASDLRALIAAASASPQAERPAFAARRAWAEAEAEMLDPLGGKGLELALLPPFEASWRSRTGRV
jgi:hypothetical protein